MYITEQINYTQNNIGSTVCIYKNKVTDMWSNGYSVFDVACDREQWYRCCYHCMQLHVSVKDCNTVNGWSVNKSSSR